jgi:4-hydroxybenzoate polyprenyltransferase
MSMSLDPTWLFLSLIPSGLGFVLFVYGKKQERWPQLVAGLAFMVYPYFATTVFSLVTVGFVLAGALWYATWAGW